MFYKNFSNNLEKMNLEFELDYWRKIEAGEIEVMLGASSNDIRLKSSYRIMDSCYIEGKDRAFGANNK